MAVEPQTQAFLDSLTAAGGPPIYTLTPDQARAVLSGAQAGVPDVAGVAIEDRVLPVGPAGKTRIRIFRPAGAAAPAPVICFFHGGGWVMGGPDTHGRLVSELAAGTGAVIVFVDYDRSPESPYPGPIEQDYAVTKYVAEHPDEFGVDATRLAVAGDSVGGNMTAVICLLAKQRGGPSIRFQLMFYPVTDANFENGSYTEFADGPWLTRAAMRWFWDAYQPDLAMRLDPTVCPLCATLEQLRDLPPALIITDENDVLRDEGEAYAARLASAGVRVTAVRLLGTIHDFVMLNAISETPAVRGAIALAIGSLRTALA